jgi:hypothetical protein
MSQYRFDPSGRFVIEDYDRAPAFASFLPGLAGPLGIPLWAFYVNRGQAIAAFGIGDKDAAMMEFQPANKAYQAVPLTGFRTFIKLGGPASRLYEPFSAVAPSAAARRRMIVGMSEVEVEEVSAEHGLQVNAAHFTLPGEPFAALVRQVTIRNTGVAPVELEVLDGLPALIPYGITDTQLKAIGRTVEAWMAVCNLDAGLPFYRVGATIGDEAEVARVEAGHFYLPFANLPAGQGQPALFVDPTVVFAQNTALTHPDCFAACSLIELAALRQITVCRAPCAFSGTAAALAPGEVLSLFALFGHAARLDAIESVRARLAQPPYVAAKRAEAAALVRSLTDPVATATADPRFDAYCRQTLLDNTLRGGWPVDVGGKVVHLYGRRHGDLERDYNAFRVPPQFYSQGNAAYRDINQNWRSDVLLNPAVGDVEILALLGLIQPDGYNPLVVHGSRFAVPPHRCPDILALVDRPDALAPLLAAPFSPGGLLEAVTDAGLGLSVAPDAFLTSVLAASEADFAAEHGEGYWMDHWYYNLDLIHSYLAVYPDRRDQLLFERTVAYRDTPWFVRPRAEKCVLTPSGVRQYDALVFDETHAAAIAARRERPNLVRAAGSGEIVRVAVFAKLLGLALVKAATLDPAGMGIEMEAGKPGWCDALNGLPGLFGSSMPGACELLRLLDFLLDAVAGRAGSLELPVELFDLAGDLSTTLADRVASSAPDRALRFWDQCATAREAYRARVRTGFDGGMAFFAFGALADLLRALRSVVSDGIARAAGLAGVPPAYFSYDVTAWKPLTDASGGPLRDAHGRPRVRPTAFAQRLLPDFLEGPVHALRVSAAPGAAADLHRRVRASDLYDRKLGMFVTNISLAECSHEIGRLRAFTPGWLENQSVFLHMAYKYLLELLRAGLHDEFFAELRCGLVPFFDPAVYGRSPLENSSFIASSAHPDDSIHGRGYVARLTGACAEFLSMWVEMTAGPQPFILRDGELCLRFAPVLPPWLFREDGTLAFTFLGRCAVTYRLLDRAATAPAVVSATVHLDGGTLPFVGDLIRAPYAEQVRRGEITRIDLDLA